MIEMYNKAWSGVENVCRWMIPVRLPLPNNCVKTSNAIYVYTVYTGAENLLITLCRNALNGQSFLDLCQIFLISSISWKKCWCWMYIIPLNRFIPLTACKGQSIPQTIVLLSFFWPQLNLKNHQMDFIHSWIVCFIQFPAFPESEIKQEQKAEKWAWAVKQRSFARVAPQRSRVHYNSAVLQSLASDQASESVALAPSPILSSFQ